MSKSVKSRYALKTAIAATFTAALFMYFHYKNPQWAVMSTLLTMQSCQDSQCFESILIAGFNRAIGAAVGIGIGLAGYWAMNAVASDGFLWLIVFVVFFALWIAVVINQRFKSLQLIPACTIMVVTMSLVDPSISIAYDRAFEVISGVLIALTFNFIFCPYRQNKELEKIFYEIIALCHNYYSHSISNISEVTTDDKRTTQKVINALLINLEKVKKSKFTFISDQNMLTQQQEINNTAVQLVSVVFQIYRAANNIRQNDIDDETQILVSRICYDLDIKFKRILKNRKIWTKTDTTVLKQLLESQQLKSNIKLIILMNHLDDLYNILVSVNTICAPNKQRNNNYRGSDSNRHGVTTTGF
jgi:uncharacterized membrane protein YgaE (UPF0421/DUF939 family)